MFSKENLLSGNVVETREGGRYLYHKIDSNKLLKLDGCMYLSLCEYNENLKFNDACFNKFDIMKVYEDYTCSKLLWERKEIKLSEMERIILNGVDEKYNWIFRNKDNTLGVSKGKPFKDKKINCYYDCGPYRACRFPFDDLFQFIQWNDEPYNIIDLLTESEE